MRALLLTLALALTLAAPADGFIYQLGRGYGQSHPNYGARVANACTSSMSFPAGYTHHLLRAYTDTDANSYVSTGVALGGGFASPIFYADNVVDGVTRNAQALGNYAWGTEHSFAILRGSDGATWHVYIDSVVRASFTQPGGRVVHLIEAGALSTSDGAQERGNDNGLAYRQNGSWVLLWTNTSVVRGGPGGFGWAYAGEVDAHYLGSAGFGYC